MRVLAAVAGFGLLLAAPAAWSHQKSTSYSTWALEADGARISARISQLDLSRVGLAFRSDEPGDPVAGYLARSLLLRAGDVPCPPASRPTQRQAPEGWVIYAWRVSCPPEAAAGPRSLVTRLLLDAAPSHLHFARLALPEGRTLERVLSQDAPRWELPAAHTPAPGRAQSGTSLPGYVVLGMEHILTGWDHVAFVLALLLLAGTLGEVATLVTAFTVAHSVTLGIATLGLVRPAAAPVEALIGFSIALVAAENSWLLAGRDRIVPAAVAGGVVLLALVPGGAVGAGALLGLALFSLCHFGLLARSHRPTRLRAVLAFAFGLVHGFGFAGVLAQMELPRARVVPALFGFNVGVELGQLAVVLVVWPALHQLARLAQGRPARLVTEVASAAICGLGLYWFVLRSLG